MLYVKLKKGLYGILQATLLFWKLLFGTLQESGFKINDYNHCIANTRIWMYSTTSRQTESSKEK